jgi:hypothetical protein
LLKRLLERRRAEAAAERATSFLEMLVDGLRLAALSPNEQIAALPDFVDVPYEIAQTYDDAWVLAPQIREAGLLTEEQYASLERIDRLFEEMRGASLESLWTIEAVREDPLWRRSRELATEALSLLGRSPGRPRFEGITWVPAGE